MTLPVAAQHLAAHGRNGDEYLLHVTGPELAGLDALARRTYGHGLTTNPHTGLPEASLLGGFLPAILGGVGMMMGIPPIWSAALVGGGTMLAGGTFGQGLMAGMGAYGGATLSGGLMDAGASAASSPAASTIGNEMAANSASMEAPMETGIGAASSPVSSYSPESVGPGFGNENPLEQAGGWNPAGDTSSLGAGSVGTPSSGAQPQSPTTGDFARMDRAGQLRQPSDVTNPSRSLFSKEGWQAYMDKMGGSKKAMQYGMMAAAPALMQGMQPKMPGAGGATDDKSLIRPYRYDQNRQFYSAQAPILAKNANSMSFYADGGAVQGYAGGGIPNPTDMANEAIAKAQANGQLPGGTGAAGPSTIPVYHYDPSTQTFTRADPAPAGPAAGGMGSGIGTPMGGPGQTFDLTQPPQYMDWARSLGSDPSAGYADGGGIGAPSGRHLQGPGDGVSDSIPATIDGQQPARLATDEYVVPARAVAEIGNGSSSAGAKRLDQMVARVQQRAATATRGRSAIARDTKAYKALPA